MWQYNAPIGPHTDYYNSSFLMRFDGDNSEEAPVDIVNSITEVGSPTYPAGVFGNAIEFDGSNDYLSETNDNYFGAITGAQRLTLFAWFKRDTTGSTEDVFEAEKEGATSATQIRFQSDNKIRFAFAESTTAFDIFTTTNTFTDTTNFMLFTAVVNAESATPIAIYINGSSEAGTPSATGNARWHNNNDKFSVGAQVDGSNKYDGKVDTLVIYRDWAMSPTEVQTFYNSTYDVGRTAVDSQTISSQPVAINNSISFNLNNLRLSIESPTDGDPTGGTVQARIWNGVSYGAWSNVTGSGEGPDDYKPTTSEANVGAAFKVDLKMTDGDNQFHIDGVRLTGISNTAIGGNGGGQETLMQGGLQ
jgi:hypothetical protein